MDKLTTQWGKLIIQTSKHLIINGGGLNFFCWLALIMVAHSAVFCLSVAIIWCVVCTLQSLVISCSLVILHKLGGHVFTGWVVE